MGSVRPFPMAKSPEVQLHISVGGVLVPGVDSVGDGGDVVPGVGLSGDVKVPVGVLWVGGHELLQELPHVLRDGGLSEDLVGGVLGVRKPGVDGLVDEDHVVVHIPTELGLVQGHVVVDVEGTVLVKDGELARAAGASSHPDHNGVGGVDVVPGLEVEEEHVRVLGPVKLEVARDAQRVVGPVGHRGDILGEKPIARLGLGVPVVPARREAALRDRKEGDHREGKRRLHLVSSLQLVSKVQVLFPFLRRCLARVFVIALRPSGTCAGGGVSLPPPSESTSRVRNRCYWANSMRPSR